MSSSPAVLRWFAERVLCRQGAGLQLLPIEGACSVCCMLCFNQERECFWGGAQPTAELVDAALKGLAQSWLDAHPLALEELNQQQQEGAQALLVMVPHEQPQPEDNGSLWPPHRNLPNGSGQLGTGPYAAAAAVPLVPHRYEPAPGAAVPSAVQLGEYQLLLQQALQSAASASTQQQQQQQAPAAPPAQAMSGVEGLPAAAAASPAAQGVQEPQPQLPVAHTQPLAGGTAMFPGLSGGAPVAVEFQETCEHFDDTLGQLQLQILAGKGQGGQGAVFEGEVTGYSGSNTQLQALSEQQDSGQRRVAVKVLLRHSDLSPSSAAVWAKGRWFSAGQRRFGIEVRAARRCAVYDGGGNVLRVYAVGYVYVSNAAGGQERRPALILEYAAGGSLRELMEANGGKLDRDPQQASHKAWRVATRMHWGLWVASKAMVVHRDCKPDNMFLTVPGDVESVKLGDFGYALLVQEAGTRGSTLVQTPGYEAPEVVDRAHNGTEMDVWLLGCSLLEMLTGEPPFYHAANLPPAERAAWRHGGELVRKASPYCDPLHPDYDRVGRHLTQAERGALQALLHVNPLKRPDYYKVMSLPYMAWGPGGPPAGWDEACAEARKAAAG